MKSSRVPTFLVLLLTAATAAAQPAPAFLQFSFATDTQRDALLSRLTPGQTRTAQRPSET